jgi:hypothetical protein
MTVLIVMGVIAYCCALGLMLSAFMNAEDGLVALVGGFLTVVVGIGLPLGLLVQFTA